MNDRNLSRRRHADNDWKACRPGTISRVATDSADLKRRQFIITSSATLATLGGGYLLFAFLRTPAVPNPDGQNSSEPMQNLAISCGETQQNLNDFISGQIDKRLAARISGHLQICQHCTDIHQAKLANAI